jgi:hypothetical protein
MKKTAWRVVIEIGFHIFFVLFESLARPLCGTVRTG